MMYWLVSSYWCFKVLQCLHLQDQAVQEELMSLGSSGLLLQVMIQAVMLLLSTSLQQLHFVLVTVCCVLFYFVWMKTTKSWSLVYGSETHSSTLMCSTRLGWWMTLSGALLPHPWRPWTSSSQVKWQIIYLRTGECHIQAWTLQPSTFKEVSEATTTIAIFYL